MTLPASMDALQMRGLGELALTRLPVPAPGPREILIRTTVATLCTSDLHDLARNPFHIPLPRVLGHEAAGVVEACGAEVRSLVPGTRVAAHPVVPCGSCEECGRGLGHLCARMGHLGLDRDGAFAEFFLQRADRVRPLPPEVPDFLGALLEPVAVCLQAVARGGDVRGRDVLVAGDGPFGNLIARLAARGGARQVTVVGREPFRLGRVRFARTAQSATPRSVDIAILAVSSGAAAVECLAALRPRGRLVLFSAIHPLPSGERGAGGEGLQDAIPLDLMTAHVRELEIVGSCNDEERLDEALACLCDPGLALSELVTHQLPFSRWPEAFDLARDGHDRALKVALTFPRPQTA